MYHIAVFTNRAVSNPYKSETNLKSHNDFRWGELHKVVSAPTATELGAKVKEALKSLSDPRL